MTKSPEQATLGRLMAGASSSSRFKLPYAGTSSKYTRSLALVAAGRPNEELVLKPGQGRAKSSENIRSHTHDIDEYNYLSDSPEHSADISALEDIVLNSQDETADIPATSVDDE